MPRLLPSRVAIRAGLGARILPCRCVAGLYETYSGEVVALLDVRGVECVNPEHVVGRTVDVRALDRPVPHIS